MQLHDHLVCPVDRHLSSTDKQLTACQLGWSSVGRAGRKHTKTKWENGAKRLPAFRRGWVRVLIRDRGRETQDTLRVENRGKTGINESGFLPATTARRRKGKGGNRCLKGGEMNGILWRDSGRRVEDEAKVERGRSEKEWQV